jgi:IMP dehydrogenase
MMKNILEWIRGEYGTHPYLVAGNIATPQGAEDLFVWGADAVKIGIGPGKVCLTKNVTGVTVPQASAVYEVCKIKNAVSTMSGHKPVFIADGGITEIGDIAKAIGLGADLAMCGGLFAGAREAPGARIDGKKVYRGMASRDAMLTIKEDKNLPTPEGMSSLIVDTNQPVSEIVNHIKGGLQSSFSYSNARTLKEFQTNCIIGSRVVNYGK